MLWRKGWIESRTRFAVAAIVLTAACGLSVLFHEPVRAALGRGSAVPLDTYAAFVYRLVYQGFCRTMFMIFAFVLGLGGVLREQELGTSGFTLALPVSRRRLIVVRAVIALIELVALALVPALVIVGLSPVVGRSYPLTQALQFAGLWIAGGSALGATAFLASAVLGGEYTAFLVAWVVFFGETVSTQFIRLRYPASSPYLFTVQEVMSGFRMRYFDAKSHILIGLRSR